MRSDFVFPRHTKIDLPVAVAGDGPYVIDRDGKRYLNGSSGAAISCLGHSNTRVLEAVKAQLDSLAFAHTSFFTNEPAETLAEMLVARAPEGLGRVYFLSGGSEANEAALKLARQYFVEAGKPTRHNIIARWQSYHGNTLGALSAGGDRAKRALYEPLLSPAIHHIAPCHYWRYGEPGESAEAYALRTANALEEKILALGPETVAAFVAETVVGSTMGSVPAVKGYFQRIREICDTYGVLLILDEVMCGMGRTGSLFACEQENVRPDMIPIAKGLGAGVQPIGALLVSRDIYAAIEAGSGFFQHGHSYVGHATACAAGVAVLREFDDRDLIPRVTTMGTALDAALRARFGNHAFVGDIRGRGLFQSLELVSDRGTNAPFAPELRLHARIKRLAKANGLMVYSSGGTVDGERGDHVLLAPPFIIEPEHIDELVDKLELSIEMALREAEVA